MPRPRVSVLVPTFEHGPYLERALGSLLGQDETAWEAVVLDDGSSDGTADLLASWPRDVRLRVISWPRNRGLGATLNSGLDLARAPVVAYLPADDVWYRSHLTSLLGALEDDAAVLAVTGVRHHGDRTALGAPPGFPAQLVQVAHVRTTGRWTERPELESDDLGLLMWDRLTRAGRVAATGHVTCEWTDHPGQRHKAMRESLDGGVNVFRSRYRVRQPLRFHSSDSGTTDEVERYRRFRERRVDPSPDGLRILLVGELAFNPERVVALAERGHRLFALWTDNPLGSSSVGPVPFGHVEDLSRQGWREALRQVRPDVVYALLNWRAVPLAHAVLRHDPGLPLVWHFKEAPQRSLVRGEWGMLADLVADARRTLVATEEERAWFLEALPGRLDPARIGVLDGDLPKADWLEGDRTPKLSDDDGEVHTVVPGRPLGLDLEWAVGLARRGVHLHLYGQVNAPGPAGSWSSWWPAAQRAAPRHLHLHPAVGPEDWVHELSRYDAGWLHRFDSDNGGELRRATWDDLNSPARLPVLLAAGLPALQKTNPGHVVAVERVLSEDGTGLFYRDLDDAVDVLCQETRNRRGGGAAWRVRREHTFDAHVDALVRLLREAVTS